MTQQSTVKIIGANGQVSLGKEFAGKMIMIDQINEGTWIIKSGEFIPDSERWLHREQDMSKLENALTWAEHNRPKDNFSALVKKLEK